MPPAPPGWFGSLMAWWHGQAIFWHEGEGTIQGVTELDECIRTEDPWLYEVQEEMRAGALSEDSWNFLHGRQTSVPGSY